MESLNWNRARLDHITALKNDRPWCVRRYIMINLKNEKCQFCGQSSEEKSETCGTSQGENEYANGWLNVLSNCYRDTSWLLHNRDLTLFSHDRVVQVMQTKDFTKWNYEALQDVVDGLMYNQKRLEEIIKAWFIRRLMAFFSPFSHWFSDIKIHAHRWSVSWCWFDEYDSVKWGFFVLGLISSTTQGAEILEDSNWMSLSSPLGAPTGVCLPDDLEKFIKVGVFYRYDIVG